MAVPATLAEPTLLGEALLLATLAGGGAVAADAYLSEEYDGAPGGRQDKPLTKGEIKSLRPLGGAAGYGEAYEQHGDGQRRASLRQTAAPGVRGPREATRGGSRHRPLLGALPTPRCRPPQGGLESLEPLGL